MVGRPVGVLELLGLLAGLVDGGAGHLDGLGGEAAGGQVAVAVLVGFLVVMLLLLLPWLLHGGDGEVVCGCFGSAICLPRLAYAGGGSYEYKY